MRNEDQESGFISHLAELRKRLIHSFIFLIVFFLFFIKNYLPGTTGKPKKSLTTCTTLHFPALSKVIISLGEL